MQPLDLIKPLNEFLKEAYPAKKNIRYMTDEERELILDRIKAGDSDKAIAIDLDIFQSRIYKIRKKL